MIAQIDNRIISSFLLYIDHEIQRQGLAYQNKTGLFFPANSVINGLTAYTTSYKQLCNDVSISGANVMSGVYINGTYTPIGSGGLAAINHYDGSIYFSSPPASNAVISGSFAVKDINVYLSDQPDYKLLFDSQYLSNAKYGQPLSGLPLDAKVAPAVFIVVKNQENKPFSFAGLDDNNIKLRAIVIAQNLFQKVAVCNIIKNFRLKPLRVIDYTPFDYLGDITGVNYNYTGLPIDSYYTPIILETKSVTIPERGEFVNTFKQMAMVDINISTWAGHA
jgi:hypothetical protein